MYLALHSHAHRPRTQCEHESTRIQLALQATLLLLLIGATMPLHAQTSTSSACLCTSATKVAFPSKSSLPRRMNPSSAHSNCTGTSMARPYLRGNARLFIGAAPGIRLTLDSAMPTHEANGDQAKLPRCPISAILCAGFTIKKSWALPPSLCALRKMRPVTAAPASFRPIAPA